jgi:hypothetical protein
MLMDDALIQTKHRFAEELVHDRKGDIEPLLADQWVIISLLQKSIRRSEVETAQRAVHASGPCRQRWPCDVLMPSALDRVKLPERLRDCRSFLLSMPFDSQPF